ncbi:MAG: hypothetical protein ACR2IW_03595 [Candidatus Fonsibacter lacus]
MKKLIFIFVFLFQSSIQANEVPAHAQGLKETLITVTTQDNKDQRGVLSLKINSNQPKYLAVLLPGYPSVVLPEMKNDVMYESKLTGNFLIRSRRHLVDSDIASLIVDCKPTMTGICSSAYQSSIERHQDVSKLILEVKKNYPSIKEVWLRGTSMGTISSSFMPTYDPTFYSGAIHTASITEPYAKGSYSELGNFNYKKVNIPQFFIHHKDDPCNLTTYSGAQKISKEFNLPLITVLGGSNFTGPACEAGNQHGFKGIEKNLMNTIQEIIRNKKINKTEIN